MWLIVRPRAVSTNVYILIAYKYDRKEYNGGVRLMDFRAGWRQHEQDRVTRYKETHQHGQDGFAPPPPPPPRRRTSAYDNDFVIQQRRGYTRHPRPF